MLPTELRLASLKHCYAQLPNVFVSKETSIKPGAIISIKSIQNDDTELFVMWNGQISGGEFIQLDLNFAKVNNLKEELVVISIADNIGAPECTLCRVELLDNSDYIIVSQHLDTNLLDTCKLISKNLIITLWLSQHVPVLVKVIDIKPGDGRFGLLNQWTEMQFQHSLKDLPKETKAEDDKNQQVAETVINHTPLVSYSLGIKFKPKLRSGLLLISGERGSGKTHLLKSIIETDYKEYHSQIYNCKQLRGKRPDNIKKTLNELLAITFDKRPSILGLDDIDAFVSYDPKHDDELGFETIYRKRLIDLFCYLAKQIERPFDLRDKNVIIIATARSLESLDPRISALSGRKYFAEIIQIGNPSLQQRMNILKSILAEQKQIQSDLTDDQLNVIAKRTDSFMPIDLKRLIERSIINACSRSLLEFNSEPLKLIQEDFNIALDKYTPTNLRGVVLKSKTEKDFSHVGGMKEIKDALLRTILMPIKYPRMLAKFPCKAQTSILLYGPPGCGKTLIVEALTNQESVNSICVNGPELLSKYIGASEAAVRDLFKRAELAKPCVIFFDQFESLVSKRGSDSTGVTDRIVNQFLTIMDGVEKVSSNIYIIAASSRPDMIDPAILRPGRLDKHIYCPIPSQEDRLDILKVLCRNIEFEEGLNNDKFYLEWSIKLDKFTGSDIQSLLYSSQLKALHELIGPGCDMTTKTDLVIKVKRGHMLASYEEIKGDVGSRFVKLMEQCPETIGKNNRLTATRATLA